LNKNLKEKNEKKKRFGALGITSHIHALSKKLTLESA